MAVANESSDKDDVTENFYTEKKKHIKEKIICIQNVKEAI